MKAGIYHGTEALCEAQVTKEVESNNPRWNEWLEFLNMMDIPRSARLCLSICSVNRRRNRKVRVLSLIKCTTKCVYNLLSNYKWQKIVFSLGYTKYLTYYTTVEISIKSYLYHIFFCLHQTFCVCGVICYFFYR